MSFLVQPPNGAPTSEDEAWTLSIGAAISNAADGIVLGAGVFYIGTTAVALTRGGGKFVVEREYRNINADGDRGPVKDRIVMEGSVAKLTLNTLEILTNITSLYPALTTTT